MGTGSPNKKSIIIWIDKKVNNEENKKYISSFDKDKFAIITCEKIKEGLNVVNNYNNKFEDIYVILSGSYYQEFILEFKKHLKSTYVVPKIIIFTRDEKLFLEKNENIKDIINNHFFNLGGIKTLFKQVHNDFLRNKTWKKEFNVEKKLLADNSRVEQYTFEYINNIVELYLPVFYKSLIKFNNSKDSLGELTHYLYELYSNNSKIKELLEPIDGISDVPIEILCKYYARLYTIDSDFYKDINKYLRERDSIINEEDIIFWADKNNYPITYIKSFYEGLKLGCFQVSSRKKLFRFSCIDKKELNRINEYITKKNKEFQVVYFFSKTFLSFSEDEKIANKFYEQWKSKKINNINIVPCKFHLIDEGNINESLLSHINIQNISAYNEKEILFLPFTCFEITKIIPIDNNNNNGYKKAISNKKHIEYYIIELNYLGKYEKELKNIQKEEIIPNTTFKQIIEETEMVEKIPNLTNNNIIGEFNEYEESFKKNNEDIYIICDVKESDIDENGYVSIFGKDDDCDFVKENKDKVKLLINNEEKALDYKYKLSLGYNKIIFIIEIDKITSLSKMFSHCTSLKSIEGLKYLDTKNIKDFSFMFLGCFSLSDLIGLENWNVSNGTNFEAMFNACTSLSNIKELKNWNVSNGVNFRAMFCSCLSISDITPLQNWNVSNCKNFYMMFSDCRALSNVTPLQNWNVSNGEDFTYMFSYCHKLSNITGLQNWNVSNCKNFTCMFCSCVLLSDLTGLQNWNVSNCKDFSQMFNKCKSLSNISALQNWNVSNSNNFESMFSDNELLSDIKALKDWNVSNCNNFFSIFSGCKSLSDLNGLQNWNVSNSNNFAEMFTSCDLLSDISALQNWNVSNSNKFDYMFSTCGSLSDISALQNWNVSNGNDFQFMFYECKLLSDISALQNWNVSNGINFENMFTGCKNISDIKPLQNWNVSNGNQFSGMFLGCQSLSDIEPLANWNVSKGESFFAMFSQCTISNKDAIKNWNTNGFPQNLLFDYNSIKLFNIKKTVKKKI